MPQSNLHNLIKDCTIISCVQMIAYTYINIITLMCIHMWTNTSILLCIQDVNNGIGGEYLDSDRICLVLGSVFMISGVLVYKGVCDGTDVQDMDYEIKMRVSVPNLLLERWAVNGYIHPDRLVNSNTRSFRHSLAW